MSDLLGPMVYGENEGEVFLGRSITRTVNMSEETMRKVDGEIRKIIDQQYAVARKLLEDNRDKVEAMAKALLELETIDADQIDDIMAGRPPRPPKPHAVRQQHGDAGSVGRRRRGAVGESGLNPIAALEHRGVLATSTPRFIWTANVTRHLSAAARYTFDLARPLVMGVLNVTPDSFSDGGRFLDRARALAHARRMRDDGADLIDIGGESTRPGAAPVAEDDELARVIPLVAALAGEGIAGRRRHAQARGDARGDRRGRVDDQRRRARCSAPGAIEACAPSDAGVCLMHMQGEPATMQDAPDLRRRRDRSAGFPASRAPRPARPPASRASASRSIRALASARRWRIISLCCGRSGRSPRPAIRCSSGLSRKSTLGEITGRDVDERLAASLAAALAAVARGASIVRVHDVRETVDALKVWNAIEQSR